MVAIMMIAVLVSLIMAGTGAALISYYRTNSTDELAEMQTSTIAESAANYVLALMCDPNSRDSVDVSITTPIRVFTIAPPELNLPTSVSKNVRSIKVVLRNTAPSVVTLQVNNDPKNYFPIAYDSKIDSSSTARSSVFNQNYWRTMTVLVQYGAKDSKNYSKGIQVALKPTAKVATPGSGQKSPTQSYFNAAAYARSAVTLANAASTQSFDGTTANKVAGQDVGGNIGAGDSISLGENVTVGGKTQFGSTATNTLASLTGAQINERIEYAGSALSVNGTPYGNDGDLASISVQNLTTPTSTKATQAALSVDDIPALAAPDSTPNISSDISNPNGSYIIDPTQVNSVNLNNLSNPVRLFIESNDTSTDPININQDIGKSNQPGNLEIWYNGQRSLNFSGEKVSALVYAPYSKVTIGKVSGLPTTFTGSIIANNVDVNNSSILRFDTRVANSNYSDVGYNKENFDFTKPWGTSSLRWQVHTVKDLNRAEFLAEAAVTP